MTKGLIKCIIVSETTEGDNKMRKHIYIEYCDHREYRGSLSAKRKLWQAEMAARALFLAAKHQAGICVHDWVIEDDDHNVLSWGSF